MTSMMTMTMMMTMTTTTMMMIPADLFFGSQVAEPSLLSTPTLRISALMLKTGSLAQDLKGLAEKWKSCFAKVWQWQNGRSAGNTPHHFDGYGTEVLNEISLSKFLDQAPIWIAPRTI